MKFKILAATEIVLEKLDTNENPFLREISIDLKVDKKLEQDFFFNENGTINKEGSKMFTDTLIQGLIANIKNSQTQNYRDEVEHIKYVISELGRGFAESPESISTTKKSIIHK